MTTSLEKSSSDFQRLCVDLLTELSQRPVGLFYQNSSIDQDAGCFVISQKSWDKFESFCTYMHQDENRKRLCIQDHRQRAEQGNGNEVGLCWAGIHNCAAATIIGNNRRIVLMGGEFISDDEEEQSLERFKKFAKSMKLNENDTEKLSELLQHVPRWSTKEISNLQRQLGMFLDWFKEYEAMREGFEESVNLVAHELLIHLTAINVESDLLREDIHSASNISKEIKRRVIELQNKIIRLQDVVSNYLVTYQEQPKFVRTTIGPIIYDAVEVYQSQAAEKMVDIRVDIEKMDSRTHELEIAPKHLRRALHNFVQNAVKYSYRGGFYRDRKYQRFINVIGRSAREFYEISIENYGIGIESDEYEKIFEQGYQGRLTKDEYRSGSGNGLYFAKSIIELHHGKIQIISIPLEGAYLTKFTIHLPYSQPNDKEV